MHAEQLPCHAYRFDRFVLDLRRGALLALDGVELPLRPKSFALLQLFVENAGRLLDRDTIMGTVWPDVFVTDDSITQCVGDIRRALGDEAQRLLRTVPRRGYLFAAKVSRAEPPLEETPGAGPWASTDQPATPAPPSAPSGRGAAQDRRNAPGEPVARSDPEAAPSLIGFSGQEPLPGSERRHLTVLACDLVNSTGLLERMDPEDAGAVMRAFLQRCATVITGCGGHVAVHTGDGMVAYFGYPHAREDAAERSVRAGLALVDAAATLETGPDCALQLRVGIATGLVVNDRIGEGTLGQLAVGRPLNLAARLQALARPAAVVIADTTRCLVGGLFALEDLGCHALKGFTEPVRAWRVIGEGMAESRFEALRGASLAPLVGRGHELSLLLDRWRQARAGEGQVVLLAGEPGIGKSRLIQALRDRLAGEPHTYLGHYCSPFHQDSPLWPVIAQLERAANFAHGDGPEQKLAKLETLLAQGLHAHGREDIAQIAPLFSSLLSIPSNGRSPSLDMSPQLQRDRTLATLVDRLAGLATNQPVLLIWEDAHWADPTSLELLELAIDRLQNLPVLALVTFRPEFDPTWPGHTHITQLTLNRLNRRCCSQLVAGLTGGKLLPAVVLDQIVARAEGVPLFVEELTKTVLEAALLREEDNGYELKGLLPTAEIPATLQDSLMARLDRLAPVKEIAKVAAVIGQEFSYELLAAVASWEKDLNEALRRLVAAELIFPRRVGSEATYVFKHALVRDAAYATLLRSTRRHLHARIATALENQFQQSEMQLELLAYHYSKAGLAGKAIGYWLKAGQLALARSATAEAVALLNKGLNLLCEMSEDPDRHRLELDLHVALGGALIVAKGFAAPETGRLWARARALCRKVPGSPRVAKVLFGQFVFHLVRAELDAALEIAKEVLHLAEGRQDVVLHLMGHRCVGIALLFLGDLVKSRKHLEQALALYDPRQHQSLAIEYIFNPRLICLCHLSLVLFVLGYPDQALQFSGEAIRDAQKLRHPNSLAHPLLFNCILCHLLGDGQGTRDRAEALLTLATEQSFPFWSAAARIIQSSVLVSENQVEERLATMCGSLADFTATGSRLFLPYFSALVAGLDRAGKLAEGDLMNAAVQAEQTGEHRWMRARTAKAARNSRSNTRVSLMFAAVAAQATGTPSPVVAMGYLVPACRGRSDWARSGYRPAWPAPSRCRGSGSDRRATGRPAPRGLAPTRRCPPIAPDGGVRSSC